MPADAAEVSARARAALDQRCFTRAAELCEIGLNRLPPEDQAVALRALRDEARRAIDPPPAGAAPPPPIFWAATELFGRGLFGDAAALFRRALLEAPGSAQVRAHLGMALVGAGAFAEGFEHFESRRHLSWAGARTMVAPLWDGRPLPGKTLLLWDEQGHGDAIQFVRFAGLAATTSRARVIFHGRPRLCRLFSRCPGISEALARTRSFPSPDAHASVMSLPALLGCGSNELAAAVPYLSPEPALVDLWRERLGERRRPRVGLFWQGNPGFFDDQRRSFPLSSYEPLLRALQERVDFFSLQKWSGEDQIASLPSHLRLRHLGGDLDQGEDGFVETAAVLSELDLLITSDSAIAHLAGALGVPVWVLLGPAADWRWGEGEATPFYPTMRLYRRRICELWPELVTRVCDRLELFLDEGGGA